MKGQISGKDPVWESDGSSSCAALVIAGPDDWNNAEITNVEYILRGYSDIIHKLTQLGADISW